MELQGKNVEKFPEEIKVKMEETLADMEETRREDSIQLRQKITKQISFLYEQQVKAVEVEKKLTGQLESLQKQKSQIEGALIALKNLLVEDK